MNYIFYGALCLTVSLVFVLLFAPVILKPSPAARRMLEMVQSNRQDRRKIGNKERVQLAILGIARLLHEYLGFSENARSKKRLVAAGFKGGNSAGAFLACSVIAPLLGIACGSFFHKNTLFWCLVLGGVMFLAPDTWLGARVRKRTEMIRRGIPDALDLLVVCVDAGLGLDQAMLRVGQELVVGHPSVSEEFMQINREQLAGKPRVEAWKSAAERTGIPEFVLFVTMLTQSDKFGTPIIKSLSRFAEEIRQKRRQRAEEKAAKTKITILFPLVLFIFPCIFIVLLAPAMFNIARSMRLLH
jgi:tight adherence protein C